MSKYFSFLRKKKTPSNSDDDPDFFSSKLKRQGGNKRSSQVSDSSSKSLDENRLSLHSIDYFEDFRRLSPESDVFHSDNDSLPDNVSLGKNCLEDEKTLSDNCDAGSPISTIAASEEENCESNQDSSLSDADESQVIKIVSDDNPQGDDDLIDDFMEEAFNDMEGNDDSPDAPSISSHTSEVDVSSDPKISENWKEISTSGISKNVHPNVENENVVIDSSVDTGENGLVEEIFKIFEHAKTKDDVDENSESDETSTSGKHGISKIVGSNGDNNDPPKLKIPDCPAIIVSPPAAEELKDICNTVADIVSSSNIDSSEKMNVDGGVKVKNSDINKSSEPKGNDESRVIYETKDNLNDHVLSFGEFSDNQSLKYSVSDYAGSAEISLEDDECYFYGCFLQDKDTAEGEDEGGGNSEANSEYQDPDASFEMSSVLSEINLGVEDGDEVEANLLQLSSLETTSFDNGMDYGVTKFSSEGDEDISSELPNIVIGKNISSSFDAEEKNPNTKESKGNRVVDSQSADIEIAAGASDTVEIGSNFDKSESVEGAKDSDESKLVDYIEAEVEEENKIVDIYYYDDDKLSLKDDSVKESPLSEANMNPTVLCSLSEPEEEEEFDSAKEDFSSDDDKSEGDQISLDGEAELLNSALFTKESQLVVDGVSPLYTCCAQPAPAYDSTSECPFADSDNFKDENLSSEDLIQEMNANPKDSSLPSSVIVDDSESQTCCHGTSMSDYSNKIRLPDGSLKLEQSSSPSSHSLESGTSINKLTAELPSDYIASMPAATSICEIVESNGSHSNRGEVSESNFSLLEEHSAKAAEDSELVDSKLLSLDESKPEIESIDKFVPESVVESMSARSFYETRTISADESKLHTGSPGLLSKTTDKNPPEASKRIHSVSEENVLLTTVNLGHEEAEARLAQRRAARAEARELRLRELEKQQQEQENVDDEDQDGINTNSQETPPRTSVLPRTRASVQNTTVSRRSSEDSTPEDGLPSSARELKTELKELDEKFRKAMITNAQLDNEKATLTFEVEFLKDKYSELEESHVQLNKEHRKRCSENEQLRKLSNKLKDEVQIVRRVLQERDELIQEYGLVLIGEENGDESFHDDEDPENDEERNDDTINDLSPRKIAIKKALLSQEASELLSKGAAKGSLDVRLRKYAEDKNNLEDEVRRLKMEKEEELSRRRKENGIDYEKQKEASKSLNEYRFRVQKAEAEVSTLQANVARLESLVARYKVTAEELEKSEEELKSEKRRLQRELRDAQNRLEELELTTSHLQKRFDKLKTARSTLLKDLSQDPA